MAQLVRPFLCENCQTPIQFYRDPIPLEVTCTNCNTRQAVPQDIPAVPAPPPVPGATTIWPAGGNMFPPEYNFALIVAFLVTLAGAGALVLSAIGVVSAMLDHGPINANGSVLGFLILMLLSMLLLAVGQILFFVRRIARDNFKNR